VANQSGVNQAPTWAQRPAYGDVKRQMELAKQAAIAGTQQAAGPLNTPRRAQRQSQGRQQAPPPQAAPAPAPTVNPNLVLAQTWQSIATIPGASDLVRYYAAKASG